MKKNQTPFSGLALCSLFVFSNACYGQVPVADRFYSFEPGAELESSGTFVTNLNLTNTVQVSSFGAVVGSNSLLVTAADATATQQFIEGALQANNIAAPVDDRRTIAFWMRANPVQSGNATMLSQGFSTQNGQRFDLRLQNGLLRLEIGGGFQRAEDVLLNDDCWHHIAVVVPEAEAVMQDVILYIDGVEQTNIEYSGNETDAINTTSFRSILGDSNFGSRDFDGYLDEVGFWSVPLTAAEVLELYGDPIITLFGSESEVVEVGSSADLIIHFDADAAVATLDSGGVQTDLIALDTDGDGKVVFTVMPTATATYTLDVQRGGESDSRSITLTVPIIPPSSPYSDLVRSDGAIAYYQFEEPAGSPAIFDSSGNGHHSVGFVGSPVLGEPGAIGQGVRLNGGESITTGLTFDPGNLATQEGGFSIELIFLADEGATDLNTNTFVSQRDGTGLGRSIAYLDGDGAFSSFLGGVGRSSGVIPGNNTLCHSVFVYDSVVDEVRYYLDGVLISTVTGVTAEAATGEWILGSQKLQASQFLFGILDEVSVYPLMLDDPNDDGDLTDSKVASHYTAYLAEAAPLLGIDADADLIFSGESATLTWKTGDAAESVSISELGIVSGSEAGGTFSAAVSPMVTTTYTITVTAGGETFTQEVTIVVEQPEADFSLEVVGFDTEGGLEILAATPSLNFEYALMRGTDLLTFATEVTTFTPSEQENILVDPAPPVGKAFYRLERRVPAP